VNIHSGRLGTAIVPVLFAAVLSGIATFEVGAQSKRSWSAPPEVKKLKNPLTDAGAAIQQGGKIFRQYCVDCYGARGDGKGGMAASLKRKPADLTSRATRTLANGEIYWRISNGDDVMPSFEKTFPLSAAERWQLVHFVKNLGNKK